MSASWNRFHLGAQGSGKTWRLRAAVAALVRLGYAARGGRVVVVDVKEEWPRATSEPWSPLTVGTRVDMARSSQGRIPDAAHLAAVTICRPRTLPVDRMDEDELHAWFGRLCALALDRGSTVLVVPEVWRYAPERGYHRGTMVRGLATLVHEHRHADVALWCDAQSAIEVANELMRRCGTHYIHGVGAAEDLRRIEAMGGKPLVQATLRVMALNDKMQGGRPGHHVVWEQARPFAPPIVYGPDGRPCTGARPGTR